MDNLQYTLVLWVPFLLLTFFCTRSSSHFFCWECIWHLLLAFTGEWRVELRTYCCFLLFILIRAFPCCHGSLEISTQPPHWSQGGVGFITPRNLSLEGLTNLKGNESFQLYHNLRFSGLAKNCNVAGLISKRMKDHFFVSWEIPVGFLVLFPLSFLILVIYIFSLVFSSHSD